MLKFDYSTEEGRDDAAIYLTGYVISCYELKTPDLALERVKEILEQAYTKGLGNRLAK